MSEVPPRRRSLLIGVLLALPSLVAALGLAAWVGLQAFEAPGPLQVESIVEIPKGTGLAGIARTLEAEGVVGESWLFRLGVRTQQKARSLQAGEYRFPAGVSMREAMEILASGKVVQYALTIPEGLTSVEILSLVAAAEALDGAAPPPPPEGSLLPETYHYQRHMTREALVGRMAAARDAALAELWPKRQADLPLASPEEAVILASVVEKETGVAAERPLVASVFINRLRKGMRLQSDPTVIYGITQGQGPLDRALTRKDLAEPTPYNSYTSDGLPPTPIANVGRAALEAALNPAESDYLYFVADGSGGHAFARTLDEHNSNVAKWRKHQKANGGSNG